MCVRMREGEGVREGRGREERRGGERECVCVCVREKERERDLCICPLHSRSIWLLILETQVSLVCTLRVASLASCRHTPSAPGGQGSGGRSCDSHGLSVVQVFMTTYRSCDSL